MNNQKENKKESTKERNKENHHHHQRLLRARSSEICHGKIMMSKIYDSTARKDMTDEQVNDWVDYMDEVGWTYTTGIEIDAKNFQRSLRMWGKTAEKLERRAKRCGKRNIVDDVDYEALAKERAEAKRREKAKDPREWEMCKERCANCLEGGGCPAFRVPPQLREWPLNAEECPGFARREDY